MTGNSTRLVTQKSCDWRHDTLEYDRDCYYYYERMWLKCHKILALQEHFTIKRTRSESSMIQSSKAEQNRQMQSRPKHRKKSSDLRHRLKAVSEVNKVMLDSRPFQISH